MEEDISEIGRLIEKGLATRFSDTGFTRQIEGDRVVFVWPSANPNVSVPLRLVCNDYPELHWHDGYFCDFIWGWDERMIPEMIEELMEFLEDFFAERILCASGGPVVAPQKIRHYLTIRIYLCLERDYWARSWRGTWDVDANDWLPKEAAPDRE